MRSAENTAHDLIAISNDLRRHINDDLAALGYVELRPSFAPLLSKLWQGGVPQGLLAEAMGVSAQAASQTVGLAEQAGYVVREPNPDDGRSKVVVLTDLGRQFVTPEQLMNRWIVAGIDDASRAVSSGFPFSLSHQYSGE